MWEPYCRRFGEGCAFLASGAAVALTCGLRVIRPESEIHPASEASAHER
jgi:hypothetical protein